MLKNTLKRFKQQVKSVLDDASNTIKEAHLPISSKKIAITGLSRSGKTVFITSIIDQLIHQKKIQSVTSKYNLFKVSINTPQKHIKRFDYYPFCKDIKINSKWPSGTDDISSITLEFETKGHFSMLANKKFNIELIDYPGEWILDIAMLRLSYEQWSEKVIQWMKGLDEEDVLQYLNTLDNLSKDSQCADLDQKLHKQYTEMLVFLKKNHYSNITPGRFVMPSDLADDPILCFAPIPKDDSSLYKTFEDRYNNYLKNVVENIQLEHFKDFDRQIVLIDIIEALQNGYPCYKDMQAGLKTMLSLYDHENKNLFSQWFSPSIKKVLFIATKADLITQSQHNNYLSLLKEMVEDVKQEMDLNHIITDEQILSSVTCTEMVKRQLDGKAISCVKGLVEAKNESEENEIYVIYPGEMPSSFPTPDNWFQAEYDYEEFLPPKTTYKENEPFYHRHMDKVIESIIGDLL